VSFWTNNRSGQEWQHPCMPSGASSPEGKAKEHQERSSQSGDAAL